MPGTVSTACKTLQATLSHVWASGSTYAEMVDFLGVTRDQIIRLRDRLQLPLRLDRSKRKKGPRHADPTPAEIAKRCAEIRERHAEQRRNEPPRTYRTTHEMVAYRLERSVHIDNDPLEQLLDDFFD